MPRPEPTFAQGDYLTDGTRLINVLLILPNGEVLVEEVGKRHAAKLGEVERCHIEVVVLNHWSTPHEWAEAHKTVAV